MRCVARERITELLFEKFKGPAVFLNQSAMLSAFESGRTMRIKLDVAHSGRSALPMEEQQLPFFLEILVGEGVDLVW